MPVVPEVEWLLPPPPLAAAATPTATNPPTTARVVVESAPADAAVAAVAPAVAEVVPADPAVVLVVPDADPVELDAVDCPACVVGVVCWETFCGVSAIAVPIRAEARIAAVSMRNLFIACLHSTNREPSVVPVSLRLDVDPPRRCTSQVDLSVHPAQRMLPCHGYLGMYIALAFLHARA